jgi:hypothetical protein
VHRTAPSFVQRAAVVALLAFAFFLAMLIAFLVRQQVGYLILAAAFLVLNLFTLIGFIVQRQNTVTLFENGLRYKKTEATWAEVVSIDDDEAGISIVKTDGSVIKVPRSIDDLGRLNALIREKTHI